MANLFYFFFGLLYRVSSVKPGVHTECPVFRPANGPGANSFNGLDFAMGLFRLDAKWARVKMDWFDLGYSSPQFGVNLVPIQMVWFLNGP
jgi:hypothetical protein